MPMTLELDTTPVFQWNYTTDTRIIINRGGSRSSKTHSLSQLFILKLITEPNKRLLISRKSFPALRTSVMNQMVLPMLKEYGLYNVECHNKTEHTYTYPDTQSVLHFISIDDPQKIRGPEWNYVWFNEANEMTFEDFRQVYMRLSANSADNKPNQFFIDFNPSNQFTWINTEIEQQPEIYPHETYVSTYQDNPFLPEETVQTIENYQNIDPNYWRIYGEGQYGQVEGLIFNNWDVVNEFLPPQECQWILYGLDFGYSNNPTALIKVGLAHGEIYLEELLYRTGLTNADIINELGRLGIPPQQGQGARLIIADSAEPKSIETIARAGYWIKPADKGKDSVMHGIDLMKQYQLHITSISDNLKKEFKAYQWETDKEGQTVNQPVKQWDHGIDAIRYAMQYKLRPQKKITSPPLPSYVTGR